MDNIIIRTATEKDLPTLLEFEQGIIKTERPFDITLKPDPISYYSIKDMISDPLVEVVTAAVGNELIGSGYAKIITAKDYYKHEKYAYLGYMYIKPKFRGKGINKLVLDNLYKWIKNHGISEVRLEVYDQNSNAIRAYEKAGFSKIITEMRRTI